MKRFLISLSLIAILVALAACGNTQPAENKEAPSEEAPVATVAEPEEQKAVPTRDDALFLDDMLMFDFVLTPQHWMQEDAKRFDSAASLIDLTSLRQACTNQHSVLSDYLKSLPETDGYNDKYITATQNYLFCIRNFVTALGKYIDTRDDAQYTMILTAMQNEQGFYGDVTKARSAYLTAVGFSDVEITERINTVAKEAQKVFDATKIG